MANLKKRNNSVRVENSRWAAYATAGAATALAGINTAEADIHHVDVNQHFAVAGGAQSIATFALAGDAYFLVRDFVHTTNVNGHASFAAVAAAATHTAGFVGYTTNPSYPRYVTKLGSNQNISLGNFVTNAGYFAYLARHAAFGQFTGPGIGFAGIRFNVGNGVQYGWVRFDMGGGPRNDFTLVDYAWADPGTPIVTGQTSAVPEPGSLALLAVGAAGLLAWRRARAQKAA